MDLDGDGHKDILTGSYGPRVKPVAGRFQILRGKPDGSFHPLAVIKGTDGEPLVIRKKSVYDYKDAINTRPTACDWDGDGKLDLIVGNSPGNFYFFKGEGDGRFQPRSDQLHDEAGEPLQVTGGHGDPVVIDWDHDGDLDLVSGSGVGHVFWAENRAGKGKKPSLQKMQTLIEVGGRFSSDKILREKDLRKPMASTRIWIDDLNADGKWDVLVGDLVHLTSPANDMSDERFEEFLAKCSKELRAIRISTDADPEQAEKLKKKRSEIYERRAAVTKRESMGFVWLYLQK